MADFQQTERQVRAVMSYIQGMDFADRQPVGKQVVDCLQSVLTLLSEGNRVQPADGAAVRSTRERIADCRQSVHKCLPVLEQLRDEWADRYRAQVGDDKEAFERLSSQMQQISNAEAYRWKHNFAQVKEAVARLGNLNGQLMDLSSQVEREHARTEPPVEDTPPLDRQDRDPDISVNLS